MFAKKFISRGVITILFWAAMWAWVAMDLHQTYHGDMETAAANASYMTRIMEGHLLSISQKMDARLLELVMIMREGMLAGRDLRTIDAHLRLGMADFPEVMSFRIANAKGRTIASSDGDTSVDISGRTYFQQLRDSPNERFVTSGPLKSQVADEWAIVFARRIEIGNGEFAGVASAVVLCGWFEDFLRDLSKVKDYMVVLWSKDLEMVAHWPPLPGYIGTQLQEIQDDDSMETRAPYELLTTGPLTGTFTRKSRIGGIKRFFHFRNMRDANLPFVLILGQSRAAVLKAWSQRAAIYAVLCSLITIISYFMLKEWKARYRYMERLTERLTREMDEKTRESRTLLDSIPDPAWMVDAGGHFVAINKTFQMFRNMEEAQMLRLSVADVCSPEEARLFEQGRQAILEQGIPLQQMVWIGAPDKTRPYEISRVPIFDETGNIYRIVGIARDLTQHYEAESRQQLISQLFEHARENLIILGQDLRIMLVNQTFTSLIGYSQEELLGRYPEEFLAEEFDQPFIQAIIHQLRNTGFWNGEFRMRSKRGKEKPLACRIVSLDNQSSRTKNWIVFMNDLSERKEIEKRIKHLTSIDAATGLPNRATFLNRLDERLQAGDLSALLVLHLNRLNHINDVYGHSVGNFLLYRISRRIRRLLRDNDALGRLSDDNFGILLSNAEPYSIETILGKIVAATSRPVIIEGKSVASAVSLGACLVPDDGQKTGELLRNANAAMHCALGTGVNTYRFFAPDMSENLIQRLRRENDLRKAMERHELQLYYQPQADIDDGRIVGCEALLRWMHPTQGVLSPLEFISLAEETGLILPIGKWVLEEACRQNKAWQDQGLPPIVMAVNISVVQLMHKQLIGDITAALRDSGLEPRWLELEITESILMEEQMTDMLQSLKALGIQLSIDDFGTGYSSLAYLRHYPFNKLKIDQSFIRDLCSDNDAVAIVRMVLGMARELRLQTVAEGVENQEQLGFLVACQCKEYQGFLCSQPISAPAFGQLLQERHAQKD
ncbi:MAG: EAL domain-containing protein [Azoarcus sp.]|jgi:diguanylate cyclase (GGDEF)-like protein/PAS domain S-box-containing protein|nr:EAL domain-containing protein [Azoarcus sp.]